MKCYDCGTQEYKPHSLAGKILRCKTCGAPHVIKHDPASGYWVHRVTDWGVVHIGVPTKWLITGAAGAAVVALTVLTLTAQKVQTVAAESGVDARAKGMLDLWLERSEGSLSLLRHRYCPSSSVDDLRRWERSTPLGVETFSGADITWSAQVDTVSQQDADRVAVDVTLTRRRAPDPGQAAGATGTHRIVLTWVRRDGQWYFNPLASGAAKP